MDEKKYKAELEKVVEEIDSVGQVTQFMNELHYNLGELANEIEVLREKLDSVVRAKGEPKLELDEKEPELVKLANVLRNENEVAKDCRNKVQYILEHLEL